MTKKEYKKIMREISAYAFPHTYKALDTECPHEESISVVGFEKITEILNRYVKGGEKRRMDKELEKAIELVKSELLKKNELLEKELKEKSTDTYSRLNVLREMNNVGTAIKMLGKLH